MTLSFDPWQTGAELGRGAFGVVYRARHRVSGAEAALKVLKSGGVEPTALRRFEREIELLRQLQHPGIVRVLDSGLSGSTPWVALELVTGKPLDEVVLEHSELATVIAKAARAVGAAHRAGVIHRDLKPANILVAEETREPKVVDFGLAFATALDLTRLSNTGEVAGTPAYLAPETLRGEALRDDPRRDVYALGVVLHERLTGAHPFVQSGDRALDAIDRIVRGAPSLAGRPGIPPRLARITDRACSLDPAARPADGDALAAELEAWLAETASSSSPAASRATSRVRLTGVVAALVGVSGLLALVLALAYGVPRAPSRDPSPGPPAPPPVSPQDGGRSAWTPSPDSRDAALETIFTSVLTGTGTLADAVARARALGLPVADPRSRAIELLAGALEPWGEFDARRRMVGFVRSNPESARAALAPMSLLTRTLGFDRAACCMLEGRSDELARPPVLRGLEMELLLLCEPPVADPVRAERLAKTLIGLTTAAPTAYPERWRVRKGLAQSRLGQGDVSGATRNFELALADTPQALRSAFEHDLQGLRSGLLGPEGMPRGFVGGVEATPFLKDVHYQEERAIDTQPSNHPKSLADLAERLEKDGHLEHAALARLRAARFLRASPQPSRARELLERSAAAPLPPDTRAVIRRALARALLDDAQDLARAEELAREAAAPGPDGDARTPCELADAWALVARARLARADATGAREAIARARALAPRDTRELDELESQLR